MAGTIFGRLAAGMAVLAALATMPAAAQPAAPAPAAAPDPRIAAAQQAFEALPEAERRAIQTDLVWTGHFSGTASGGFGPLTFRAINAFTGKVGPAADGRLDAGQRRALAETAAQARARVGFSVQRDAATGVAIGVPERVLTRREALPNGTTRWQSADGRVTLDTRAGAAGDTLEALFERATAMNPNVPRRVTYKILRPDFYVVSGETPTGKFYQRMASGAGGLRGFSIGYDKALAAQIDPLVIAIANAFEPFPGTGPAAAPVSSAAPAPVAARAARFLTALVVADGLGVTAHEPFAACRNPSVPAGPVRLRQAEEASGLALVELPGARGGPLRLGSGSGSEAVVLAIGEAGGERGVVAIPGEIAGAAIRAALQPGAAGSPVFDRDGALVGLVTGDPAARFAVAGTVPERLYPMQPAAALARLAGLTADGAAPPPARTTGAIAAAHRAQVASIGCQP